MASIAVVENNRDNRLLLRAMLDEHYEVDEYATGFEAIKGFDRKKPDLIVTDISLPGMDGIELLRHIRSNASLQHLPIFVVTAHAMGEDREKYLAVGFDEYFAKPLIDEKSLLEAISGRLRKE